VGPPPTSVPASPEPTPIGQRQKRVVEATASEDEDTYTCLVFKRKRGADVVAPSHSASDGHVPSLRENPPSASSPRDLMVVEGGGRAPLEMIKACPLLAICPPFCSRPSSASRTGKWWRAWVGTPYKIMQPKALGSSSSRPASP